ncbi:hypothetical protein [Streptococcus marmotae]|uniref:hypothetical protein n=1 Tax=Streptococcus marmotae TaxID=1825069 RepID=UPI00082AA513|nr:hypothetical protein [Streptococcus marmotae]
MREYKRLVSETKELERELYARLIKNFQAPEYNINHEREFVSQEEYQKSWEVFQEGMLPIMGETAFYWRETTLQEKLDWAKSHHTEKLVKLEKAKSPLGEERN